MKRIRTEADLAREDMHDLPEEDATGIFVETAPREDEDDFFTLFAVDTEEYCDEEIEYYDLVADIEHMGWVQALRL